MGSVLLHLSLKVNLEEAPRISQPWKSAFLGFLVIEAMSNFDISMGATSTKKQTAKPLKYKPRNRDKEALAAKRRCVSTACIACRRRKSKVSFQSGVITGYCASGLLFSAMVILQAAPLVLQCMGLNACTIRTLITEERASTRRTSII